MPARLVLASASPRRLALLAQIGVTPDLVVDADVDERPLARERARDMALRLAQAKARGVAARPEVQSLGERTCVLAADTVVACGRRLLPKALSPAEAKGCLALLSGRRHRVVTAVVLLGPGELAAHRLVETRVAMKRLSVGEIAQYLASGEWQGKAGGYAIQGLAAAFIPWIAGSYGAVVGLPLAETASLLAARGLWPAGVGDGRTDATLTGPTPLP